MPNAAPPATVGRDLLLQVRDLSKSFPGVQALDGVRMDVARGQVHALMGENGAGKSTLVNILAGLHRPDSGSIHFKDGPVRIRNPHNALQLGVAMIHQELLVFPEMTVAENIFMGHEPVLGRTGWIDRGRMHDEARVLLERLGVSLSPARKLKELSVAQMQTVEIAKALAHRADLIIMDEPTSAISELEVQALFKVIRDLKAQGVAVIYISHRMEEIFQIADVVTVLRDGQYVATHPVGELSTQQLIALMVGRELGTLEAGEPATPGEVVLSVSGLTRPGKFRDVQLQVRRGEVVGLAGLMGAGRTEVLHAIYGLEPATRGVIEVDNRPVRIRNPRDGVRCGMALVGEDRRETGLVLTMSVQHNLTLSSLQRCVRGPFIDSGEEQRIVTGQIGTLRIRTPSPGQIVRNLSGGNQQKVVMGKALLTEPQILLLDEPTRGIDIGAKMEIYALIRQLAREGKAILLVSSELPEILALTDRLLVMREGIVTAELEARQTTQEEIMRYAMPE